MFHPDPLRERAADTIERLTKRLEEAEIEHVKQIADMATRFRAVNIERVIEATGQDILAMRERLEEAEKVIRPFADEEPEWGGFHNDENLVESWTTGPSSRLRVSHLRAAARWLEGK